MRCCLILTICSLTIGSANAADFGGRYQDPVQQPSQKDDGRPRDADSNPREANPGELRETGFYQAGPRSGGFEGASGSYSIRGGGFTLPEIRLALPTFELPSLFRTRRSARMVYKGGEAPWVSTGFEVVGANSVANRGARDANQGDARSRGSDECLDLRRQKQEYQRKIEELDRQLEECSKMSLLLQERLRSQAAAVPAFDDYGQAAIWRLPSALRVSTRNTHTPLPSMAQLASGSVIQRASFSAAQVPRREPGLLRRQPQDEMTRLPYPNTPRNSTSQYSGRVYR